MYNEDVAVPSSESITFRLLKDINKEIESLRQTLRPISSSELQEQEVEKSPDQQTRLLQELEDVLVQIRVIRRDIRL